MSLLAESSILPLRLPLFIERGDSFQPVLTNHQDVVGRDVEGIGSGRVAVLAATDRDLGHLTAIGALAMI